MTGKRPGLLEASSVFRIRNFRYFLAGRLLLTIAIQIQSVAVGWQVYDISGDPMALAYVGLSQFLPMMLLILPAGDLADRVNRRTIMVVGCLIEAAVAAGFLLLTFFHVTALWPFYAVLALFGVGRALAGPAQQSLLPRVVPAEHLSRAIAWTASTFQTAIIAGPAIGGALYVFGPTAAYFACLGLALVDMVLFARIEIAGPQSAPADPAIYVGGGFRRALAGIGFIRARPIILGAISLDLFAVLLGGVTALLPIYAKDILFVSPAGLGLLRAAPAVGATTMGILLGHYPLSRKTGPWMFGCVALFGVATIAFGLSTNFYLSLAALVVLGASDMVSVFVRTTLIQMATPDEMRGRVSAVSMLFIGASNELGEFESGTAAHFFGTVPSAVIGGLGTLAVVGLWMWFFPGLRRIDRLTEIRAG
jgi:MFS family permease